MLNFEECISSPQPIPTPRRLWYLHAITWPLHGQAAVVKRPGKWGEGFSTHDHWVFHRENGKTIGMVPLIINPIYTLYSDYSKSLLDISPLKGLLGGVKQLGALHPKGTTIFPPQPIGSMEEWHMYLHENQKFKPLM